MTTPRRSRPLYRNPNDSMIGGVCSGLGHYFDVDTILIRVAFVVVAMFGGGGVLAYVILWAVLDAAPPGLLDPSSEPQPRPVGHPVPPADLEDTTRPEADGHDHVEPSTSASPRADETP